MGCWGVLPPTQFSGGCQWSCPVTCVSSGHELGLPRKSLHLETFCAVPGRSKAFHCLSAWPVARQTWAPTPWPGFAYRTPGPASFSADHSYTTLVSSPLSFGEAGSQPVPLPDQRSLNKLWLAGSPSCTRRHPTSPLAQARHIPSSFPSGKAQLLGVGVHASCSPWRVGREPGCRGSGGGCP